MATETTSDSSTDSTETVEQDNKATDQTTAEESSAGESQGQTQAATSTGEQAQNSSTEGSTDKEQSFNKDSLLADLKKERESRRTLQAQVEKLTADLGNAGKASEQLTAVQRKYDRLEAFLLGVGGPLAKALDSKSFTTSLFETDEEIDKLVADWQKDNPTPTSVALGSKAAEPAKSKVDMNSLLRAAK